MTVTTLSNGQTLVNVTILSGNSDLETSGSTVYVAGMLKDAGILSLSGSEPTFLVLHSATISVASGGVISMSNSENNHIYALSGTSDALVNAKGTIEGGGQIGSGASAALTLTNQAGGVIDANQSGAALIINTGTIAVINHGLIEATGAGGLTITDSIIDDASGTLLASGSGDNIYLAAGADIVGGALKGNSGGSFQVTGGAILDGSTSAVTLDVATAMQIDDGGQLNIFGTLADVGTISLTAYDYYTSLVLDGATVSVARGGVISLGHSHANQIYGSNGTRDLLVNAGIIEGAGQIGSGTTAALTLTNEAGGVIDANQSGASLVINTGTAAVINDGLIEATGAGGLTITDSIIDDASGTLLASGSGDNIYLATGADIVGGPLKGNSGGRFQVSGNVILDGSTNAVTLDAATTMQIDDNGQLNIFGTLDDVGTISLAAYDYYTSLVLDSATISVASGGVISMGNSGRNQIYGASGTRDALVNAGIIEGGGQIGSGTTAGLTLTNQAGGVIDANQSGAALIINTGTVAVINDGLIEATGAAGLTITDSTINDASGTLLADGSGDNIYLAAAADIVGGPLDGMSGGSFQVTGDAILDGSTSAVTLGAATTMQIDDGQQLNIFGTLDDVGTISLAAYDYYTSLVLDSATISVASGGVISMGNSGRNQIYGASGTRDALVNAGIIEGGGQIGSGTTAGLTLTNQAGGVIDANQSGAALIINTGTVVVINNGLIEATAGGGLTIESNLTNDGLIEATGAGGLTITDSIIDDASGTLLASGSGDNIYLATGADIVGGPLKGNSGGRFQVSGNVILDGSTNAVTLDAATTMQIDDNGQLNIFGTLADLGTITLTAYDYYTSLVLDSATISVASGGVISMGNSGRNQIYGASGTRDALVNAGIIEGGGQIGSGTTAGLTLTNQAGGVIDANQSGAALIINTGTVAVINDGLIEATGAAGLTITDSTINDASGTLLADGSGDNIYLAAAADIVGGPLDGMSGGSFQVTGDAILDGSTSAVTLGAATTMQIDDGQQLNIFGTLDDVGTISLAAYDYYTSLVLDSATISVASGGVISMGNSGRNQIYGASGTRDALVNAGIIEGGGQIGSGTTAGLTLTNQAGGVIDANQSGAALIINTGTVAVINDGLIEATGAAGLTITDSTINDASGTLLADGSGDNIYLAAAADIVGGPLDGMSGGSFQVTGDAILDGSTSAVTLGAATTMQIDDGQQLNIFGTLDDVGTISLAAYDYYTSLVLDSATISVASGGVISMGNSGRNQIYGASGTRDALVNAGIIEGGGQIGSGTTAGLTLTNQAGGVIDANQSGAALIINTGTVAVINDGLIEATGAAGLTIESNITNNGHVLAEADTLAIAGYVSGSGSFTIGNGATLELGGTSAESILLQGITTAGAHLILDEPSEFRGKLISLAAGDTIDLVGTSATSVQISGGHLVVSLTAGGTLSYILASPQSNIKADASSNGNGGSYISISSNSTSAIATSTVHINAAESVSTISSEENNIPRAKMNFLMPTWNETTPPQEPWTGARLASSIRPIMPPTGFSNTADLPKTASTSASSSEVLAHSRAVGNLAPFPSHDSRSILSRIFFDHHSAL